MTFPAWALAVYGGLALFFASAWIFGKDKIKSYAANGVLIVLTAFVAHFLSFAVATQHIGRSNAGVGVQAGEMSLRLLACFDALRHSQGGDKAEPGDVEKKQRKESFDANEKTLEEAVTNYPKNPEYPAKLIILLGLNRTRDHVARIKQLDQALKEQVGTPDDSDHELAKVLSHLYVKQEVAPEEVGPFRFVLEKHVAQGWYQDEAVERLLELQSDKSVLKRFQDERDTKNKITFVKLSFILIGALLAGVVGIFNVFVQLAMTGAKPAKKPDEVGLDVPLKSVYAVFITWFSIQILVSTVGHLMLAQHAELAKQPNMVALVTMVTYLISNIPGPILIYYIALKPRGKSPQDFWSELKIRARTSTSGPVKIVLLGCLTWCSLVPIVLAATFAASKLFHTQSSDNPVISQIIQTANATAPLAVFVFYFTLAVMAPFFEEILFRGFMFGALKPRIGAFFAMLASAATFAAMHFDKGGALMLFSIGFVLAFSFNRSRSLVTSMVAHGLWNAGTFTLVLTLFGS